MFVTNWIKKRKKNNQAAKAIEECITDGSEVSFNHVTIEKMMNEPLFREGYEEESLALDFALLLADIMEEKGIDAQTLAEKADVKVKYINSLLAGVKNVNLREAANIMFHLNRKIILKTEKVFDTN